MAKRYQPRPPNPKLKSRRPMNESVRAREYLTPDEISRLIYAASCRGRNRERDELLLTLMYRHGLRAQEAARLTWDAVMLDQRQLHINRLKGSQSGTHPLQPDEIAMLTEAKACSQSHYVFLGAKGKPLATSAIARIVTQAAKAAEIDIKVHPHMLRHACGYYLANELKLDTRLIQQWLGHTSIQHTVRYTALNPDRFKEVSWQ